MKLASLNPLKFAGALRTLAVTASLALIASLAAAPVYAATPKPLTEAESIAKGLEDAPSIVATAKLNCDIANAKVVGPTDTEVNGAKVKGTIYELACKSGPGFIITAISLTQTKDPFSCNYLVKVREKVPDSLLCTLPENTPPYKWLTPVVQPYLPGCEVTNARVIGSSTSGAPIDRYEVACATGIGGIIDYAQLGTDTPTEFKSCLFLEGTPSTCTYTTKAQIIETMRPIAAAGNAKCVVTDVRFVGITKESDGYYYEFGCATPPGFIVLTKVDNSFVRNIPCASAAGLGGCKFTDAGVAAADANGRMSAQLKEGGFPCTVKDYEVIGTQESTKRDYIEFTCPEQPFGLIGFIPQEGSTAALRVNDCFLDQVGRKSCTLTKPDVLLAQVDKLIKIAKPDKGCDVSEVRYIGESDTIDAGVIVEIACKNKRGYIAVIAADRQSLGEAIPCTIAKAHKEEQQCEIAGNGTYASAE